MHEQGEEFLASLAGVVDSLASEVPVARLDRKGLAALSAGLQQFQEDALGVKVTAHPLAACLALPQIPVEVLHAMGITSHSHSSFESNSVGLLGWR